MDIHRLTDAIGDRSIAVVIPSDNAGLSIASVVIGFQKALPGAEIIVFDNCSDDNTAHMARAAGARIVHEPRRGRTSVIARIFSDVDADLIVMASADGTHDPALAPMLVGELIGTGSDMAVCVDKDIETGSGAVLNRLFRTLLDPTFTDIFSGYRVFTRRFVKSFPATGPQLDTLAEMSVHAFELQIPTCEFIMEHEPEREDLRCKPQNQPDRAPTIGSFVKTFKTMHPARFFAIISALLAGAGLALAVPTIVDALQTGEISGSATMLLTTILATGLMLAAVFVAGCGMILGDIRRVAIEQRRLTYLSLEGFGAAAKPNDIRISEVRDDTGDRNGSDVMRRRDFPASANAA